MASDMAQDPIVDVRDLRVQFDESIALHGVSLQVPRGQIVGIVGESGSGKSVLLKSIVGLVDGVPGAVDGQIDLRFADGTTVKVDPAAHRSYREKKRAIDQRMAKVRGARVGLVLQNGRAALDPFRTIGAQVGHAVRTRELANGATSTAGERDAEALAWLGKLSFEDPEGVARRYPHELSGGMAQRAMLATVLARKPEVLLLDEVNTGLDATVQAELLRLLERIHQTEGFSALFVSHDIGATLRLASTVVVMQRGRVVETSGVEALRAGRFENEYTERLLLAASSVSPGPRPNGEVSLPLVRLERVGKTFRTRTWIGRQRSASALRGINAEIRIGQCVAIVGESGSGKTTLARMLVGLTLPSEGNLRFVPKADGLRKRILFQNPYTSLNVEMTPAEAIVEILRHEGMNPRDAAALARQRLAEFGLEARGNHLIKFLSGGERRRVGIIRALESTADLVVLDEPTSNLDAVYRVLVAGLLNKLRGSSMSRTYVIVSHDLRFVRSVADRVLVLQGGNMVDDVPVSALDQPEQLDPYTRELLRAADTLAGMKTETETSPERAWSENNLVRR